MVNTSVLVPFPKNLCALSTFAFILLCASAPFAPSPIHIRAKIPRNNAANRGLAASPASITST